MSQQEIKCKVGSCKYNSAKQQCTLDEITVGCEPNCVEPNSECETVCASFCHK